MDKSLKKLSRVELLEVMVNLSEDYERVTAENARLKKMVSSQRLPRSAKVGSIAEAALQANGYFSAAQRSADEYLREIKHLRDELANRAANADAAAIAAANQRAEEQAQGIVREAQMRANQIIGHANSQAEAIIAEARRRSDEVLADANRQSHAILAQTSQRLNGASVGRDAASSVTSSHVQPQQGMRAQSQTQAYPRVQMQAQPQIQAQASARSQVQSQPQMQVRSQARVQPQSDGRFPVQDQAQSQARSRSPYLGAVEQQQQQQQQPVAAYPSAHGASSGYGATSVPPVRQNSQLADNLPGFNQTGAFARVSAYSDNRPYANSAPAYAGGTAVPVPSPDDGSEFAARQPQTGYPSGGQYR